MVERFGIHFRQNIIDVYVLPWKGAISNPMFISHLYSSDLVVDILTHELFHRLLTDNEEKIPYGRAIREMYGHEEASTINHVFVHAGLQFIYLDVLKEPNRLTRNISRSLDRDGYKRAWEIVHETGYNELIERLKVSTK
jgi:hypothetical protein